jgi:hypothetical protein
MLKPSVIVKEVKRLFAVFLLYFPVAGQSDWRLLQKSGGNVEKGGKKFRYEE